MKKFFFTLLLVSPLFAIYEVGDSVPNQCWTTYEEKNLCLNDYSGMVRVLIFNTGWCPDCVAEFRELIPKVKKFDQKPVRFISLSAAGWTKSATPDVTFLKEWKTKFQIPFDVAASPKNAGKDFFEQTFIPNFVIIDKEGKVAYKTIEPVLDPIFEIIEKLAE